MKLINLDTLSGIELTPGQAARLKAAMDANAVKDEFGEILSWESCRDFHGDICVEQGGYDNCFDVISKQDIVERVDRILRGRGIQGGLRQAVASASAAARRDAAAEWQRLNSLNEPSGFVIFYEGKACAWTRALDRPRDWMPGVIAHPVDGQGPEFITVGGDGMVGAAQWVQLETCPVPKAPVESAS